MTAAAGWRRRWPSYFAPEPEPEPEPSPEPEPEPEPEHQPARGWVEVQVAFASRVLQLMIARTIA
eukprot:4059083-Prymnesium_polylepis.1